MNELKILEQREILGKKSTIYGTVENPLFLAKEIAEWIDYTKTSKGAYNVSAMLAMVGEDEKLVSKILISGQMREMWFLTEDGLYEVLMQSRKPIAKQFKAKVKEILRTIRKTGAYMTPEIIEKVLSDPDTIIALATKIKTLQADVKILRDENSYNYSLIQGLNRKLSLAEMRQILNRVVRKVPKYPERWSELYKQFDMKYHMNVRVRARARNVSVLDYIEEDLQMLPELFDIACKLYESEVDSLVNEIYNLRAV